MIGLTLPRDDCGRVYTFKLYPARHMRLHYHRVVQGPWQPDAALQISTLGDSLCTDGIWAEPILA